VQTDDFGDFWFERLEPDTYTLLAEKDGYLPRRFDDIKVSKDVNMGDIELFKRV